MIMLVPLACFSQKKASAKDASFEALEALVNGKEFITEYVWAQPQNTASVSSVAASNLRPPGSSGNRFNLIGNYNFLKIENDVVTAYLPYFGERQVAADHYSGSNAIEFEGVPENLTIEKNEKKKRFDISFSISNKTEVFQVQLQLYHNMNAQLVVNSNQRFVIRYDGEVKALTEKKEEG